ncbi:hypothetical protein TESG_03800 [Trichophyton tonsurans CBS 112818]|uniref:Uncharacterized protein n=1 Tax=Trichophyton tonsurans (strain CBS 112818) TaxID=647933 RepID=F2RYF2_TRIT1|nr:hypothetical protein TESG_03800 [Trichophyton tonsurans CBS 112818]
MRDRTISRRDKKQTLQRPVGQADRRTLGWSLAAAGSALEEKAGVAGTAVTHRDERGSQHHGRRQQHASVELQETRRRDTEGEHSDRGRERERQRARERERGCRRGAKGQ